MEKGYYELQSGTHVRVESTIRTIELFHEGRLLYFDGVRMTPVEYLDTYNIQS